ncbi:hypothetical protein JW964_08285, partial [candidate division KSB1 bacterium]|nr:hypothetical protein [candidate division KSB1 bacterium]
SKIQATGIKEVYYEYQKSGNDDFSRHRPVGVSITFEEKIGPHDITIVKVKNLAGFINWIQSFVKKKNLDEYHISTEFETTIGRYLERGIRYFVFDIVELPVTKVEAAPADSLEIDPAVEAMIWKDGSRTFLPILPEGPKRDEEVPSELHEPALSVKPVLYHFSTNYLYYPQEITATSDAGHSETTVSLFLIVNGKLENDFIRKFGLYPSYGFGHYFEYFWENNPSFSEYYRKPGPIPGFYDPPDVTFEEAGLAEELKHGDNIRLTQPELAQVTDELKDFFSEDPFVMQARYHGALNDLTKDLVVTNSDFYWGTHGLVNQLKKVYRFFIKGFTSNRYNKKTVYIIGFLFLAHLFYIMGLLIMVKIPFKSMRYILKKKQIDIPYQEPFLYFIAILLLLIFFHVKNLLILRGIIIGTPILGFLFLLFLLFKYLFLGIRGIFRRIFQAQGHNLI